VGRLNEALTTERERRRCGGGPTQRGGGRLAEAPAATDAPEERARGAEHGRDRADGEAGALRAEAERRRDELDIARAELAGLRTELTRAVETARTETAGPMGARHASELVAARAVLEGQLARLEGELAGELARAESARELAESYRQPPRAGGAQGHRATGRCPPCERGHRPWRRRPHSELRERAEGGSGVSGRGPQGRRSAPSAAGHWPTVLGGHVVARAQLGQGGRRGGGHPRAAPGVGAGSAGPCPLRPRTKVHRPRRGRLVPLQRDRHGLHRPSHWQNAWIESFNGRLRDEFLNGQCLETLEPQVSSRTGGSTTT